MSKNNPTKDELLELLDQAYYLLYKLSIPRNDEYDYNDIMEQLAAALKITRLVEGTIEFAFACDVPHNLYKIDESDIKITATILNLPVTISGVKFTS